MRTYVPRTLLYAPPEHVVASSVAFQGPVQVSGSAEVVPALRYQFEFTVRRYRLVFGHPQSETSAAQRNPSS